MRRPRERTRCLATARAAPVSCAAFRRGVAQPGRALLSGGRSRRFESCHPDQNQYVTNEARPKIGPFSCPSVPELSPNCPRVARQLRGALSPNCPRRPHLTAARARAQDRPAGCCQPAFMSSTFKEPREDTRGFFSNVSRPSRPIVAVIGLRGSQDRSLMRPGRHRCRSTHARRAQRLRPARAHTLDTRC